MALASKVYVSLRTFYGKGTAYHCGTADGKDKGEGDP